MDRSAVTNVEVGQVIGLDHTSISRLRSGARHPSLTVMRDIARKFGWSLDDQASALENKEYSVGFERVLIEHYGKSQDVATGA